MEANALSSVPDIITAASKSPSGLMALAVVAVASVALILFKNAKPAQKLGVFALVVAGATAFVYVLLQVQRDEATRQVADAATIRDLQLHLVFKNDDLINPMHATVQPYVQGRRDTTERLLTDNVQYIRGVGGLTVDFSSLTVGDRLFVVVEDHGKRWRSDDMRLPEAQLAMSAIQP